MGRRSSRERRPHRGRSQQLRRGRVEPPRRADDAGLRERWRRMHGLDVERRGPASPGQRLGDERQFLGEGGGPDPRPRQTATPPLWRTRAGDDPVRRRPPDPPNFTVVAAGTLGIDNVELPEPSALLGSPPARCWSPRCGAGADSSVAARRRHGRRILGHAPERARVLLLHHSTISPSFIRTT
jgi:hypothetical protein